MFSRTGRGIRHGAIVVGALTLAVLFWATPGEGVVIENIKVLSGQDQVRLVLQGNGELDCKVFKFEDPLRLALDFAEGSVRRGVFPHVVVEPPVLQVIETTFGKQDEGLRVEVVLSDNAAWSVRLQGHNLVLDLRVHEETVQLPAERLLGAEEPIIVLGSAASGVRTTSSRPAGDRVLSGAEVLTREQAGGEGAPTETGALEEEGWVAPEGYVLDPRVGTPPGQEGLAAEVRQPTRSVPGEAGGYGMSPGGAFGSEAGATAESEWGAYLQGSESMTLVGGQRYTGRRISLSLKDADLLDVLRHFGEISGFNIVLDPGVRGLVTVYLEDVPWDQALDIILKNNSLGRTFEGNVMRIATLAKLKQEEQEQLELDEARKRSAPLYTEIVYVSYADAGQVVSILRGALSQRGTMSIDERTNSIIVTDVRSHVEHIKKYIRLLDRRTRQVSINTRIVTATKNFTRNLGLSYAFSFFGDAAHGSNTRYNFPYNYNIATAVNLPGQTVPEVGQINMGDIMDTTFVNLALHAAESDGTGKVIANPKIITSDNETAIIRSGIQVPYVMAQGDIQVPTGGGGTIEAGTTQFIQFQNAEVAVTVTPHITNDDYISMNVEVDNNTLGSGSPPSININQAKSKVLVKDGDTFVIGGFKQINLLNNEDRIPVIGEVPVIGWFFKAKSKSQTLSDLLIFITPTIVQDEQTALITATAEE
jgi:type IV pilus assembly protein PilQ